MTEWRPQEGTKLIPGTPQGTGTETPDITVPGTLAGSLRVAEDCRAVSEVLSRVGDKWTVLVVSALGEGPKRFNELRRALGSISQRMLTLTVRALERDGLVTRTAYPTIPPRVDYELTELGCSLLAPVSALGLWARTNRPAIQEARQRFDKAAT